MGEDRAVGFEGNDRTAVRTFAYHLDFRGRSAFAVRLAVDLAVAAVDLGDQQRRKRIDAGYTHAVKTARNLVAALVEFTSGMQHRQHDFECRFALLLVEVGGDTAAVVLDGDRVVLVDRHVDIGAIARQRLVDRVVHDLVNQVVETLFADIADVHGRTLAHRFEAFEDLDIRRGIFFFLLFNVF